MTSRIRASSAHSCSIARRTWREQRATTSSDAPVTTAAPPTAHTFHTARPRWPLSSATCLPCAGPAAPAASPPRCHTLSDRSSLTVARAVGGAPAAWECCDRNSPSLHIAGGQDTCHRQSMAGDRGIALCLGVSCAPDATAVAEKYHRRPRKPQRSARRAVLAARPAHPPHSSRPVVRHRAQQPSAAAPADAVNRPLVPHERGVWCAVPLLRSADSRAGRRHGFTAAAAEVGPPEEHFVEDRAGGDAAGVVEMTRTASAMQFLKMKERGACASSCVSQGCRARA